MSAFAHLLMCGLAVLSDANVDAPTNASVAFDHFVGLLILTVCVETVGSRLCSSYIYFVSSQYVSDPINSIIFSCALLACETDPVTCRPHVWLGVAQLREKLTILCAHAMKCHGARSLQRSGRKFPLALTHACRHLLTCSCVAWRCSATTETNDSLCACDEMRRLLSSPTFSAYTHNQNLCLPHHSYL